MSRVFSPVGLTVYLSLGCFRLQSFQKCFGPMCFDSPPLLMVLCLCDPGAPKPNAKRPLAVQRWRQFWFAPVTSFLGNVLMYFLFLGLFAYVLLVDFKAPPPVGPSPTEIVLYFWVFTLVCEEIRQVGCSDSGMLSDLCAQSSHFKSESCVSFCFVFQTFFVDGLFLLQKMRNYIQDVWNKCDLTAIFLFILGLCCRSFGLSTPMLRK